MADVTPIRTRQQMKGSGLAGLLGLFAALCAIFSGCATLIDWNDEAAQARWPVVAATVERAVVVASRRGSKDGGGMMWKLGARVRYDVEGEALIATLSSRPVYSEQDAATLRSWAMQHRNGSHLDIRYDPSQPGRIVFASAQPELGPDRIRSDLILFAVAAIGCAGLIWLARYLRAREASAGPVADDTRRANPAFGLLFAATGSMIMGLAIYGAAHADASGADRLMALPMGLMFVFAGILIALPAQYAKWRTLLTTLVITCFALTFDWVAFGPGERRFAGNIGGIGFMTSEMTGRIVFGIFAVVLDACAIGMWIGMCRQMFGSKASAASSAASTI